MKNLKAKLRKNGGFTLIEMLIVVAIIAILVAVSIPLVGQALEKARDATDQANERAAKAEALLVYLSGGTIYGAAEANNVSITAATPFGSTGNTPETVYYDVVNGRLTTVQPKAYGKCTYASGDAHYESLATGAAAGHSSSVLTVAVDANGNVTLTWAAGAK